MIAERIKHFVSNIYLVIKAATFIVHRLLTNTYNNNNIVQRLLIYLVYTIFNIVYCILTVLSLLVDLIAIVLKINNLS